MSSAYPASVDDLDGSVAGESLWVGRESSGIPSVVCKGGTKYSQQYDSVQSFPFLRQGAVGLGLYEIVPAEA
jgi:hypothetical protein